MAHVVSDPYVSMVSVTLLNCSTELSRNRQDVTTECVHPRVLYSSLVCSGHLTSLHASTSWYFWYSEPTVFENYVHDLYVDDQVVELSLWDTAGASPFRLFMLTISLTSWFQDRKSLTDCGRSVTLKLMSSWYAFPCVPPIHPRRSHSPVSYL